MDDTAGQQLTTSVWSAFSRSVRNNTLAEFGGQAVRFGGMVVLARALTPSDFGILKALAAISIITSMFIEAGIPDALIQRRELTWQHECTAWWLSIIVTFGSVATVFTAAPLLASWMNMPALKTGIRLVALPLLLDGSSIVSNARLQRRMNFAALALADVLAEIAFLGCALSLIASHKPEWSLVGGLAARYAMHGATIWVADAHLPIGVPRIQAARDLSAFTLGAWGARIAAAASDNTDYLLIGRLLGSGPLGLYGMARDLLRFVPNRLHKVAGRVTFSAFSKLQDHDAHLGRTYVEYFGSLARIVVPIIVCIAVAGPNIVVSIYGHKWLSAAMPLQILSVGIGFLALNVGLSSLFLAKGNPLIDMYLNLLRMILIVAVVVAFQFGGLLGVCAGITAAETVVACLSQGVGFRFNGLTARELLSEALPAVRLGLACGLSAFAGQAIAKFCGASAAIGLFAAAVPAGLLYLHLESANLLQMLSGAFRSKRTGEETLGKAIAPTS